MFLTAEDIERLTGYKRKREQCAELTRQGVPYRVNARGEPIVTEAYINGTKQQSKPTGWQPNIKVG